VTTQSSPQGTWDKVEKTTNWCLQLVLASFIGSRLAFAEWWPLPTIDFILSAIALLLVLASFRYARHHRSWRLWVIGYASATQLVPMVIREPVLLLPLLGALIPVAILLGSLIALSRKGPSSDPQRGS
jgi:uncharacterized membrane protein AbrB (regulator of aidB expression)